MNTNRKGHTMTSTLDILTIKASAKLDITEDAAQGALEEYIRQIESLESRSIDPENIDADDADFLLEAVVLRVLHAGHESFQGCDFLCA